MPKGVITMVHCHMSFKCVVTALRFQINYLGFNQGYQTNVITDKT